MFDLFTVDALKALRDFVVQQSQFNMFLLLLLEESGALDGMSAEQVDAIQARAVQINDQKIAAEKDEWLESLPSGKRFLYEIFKKQEGEA